ncbi:MAG: hypothetical protein RLZ61_612, partial [Planctomycetota bacterium]
IELNPSFTAAYNHRGNSAYAMKNYTDAINDYTKAIELDPADANLFNNRAKTFKALGKDKEAEDDLVKVKRLAK